METKDILLKLRTQKGLSQEELAAKAHNYELERCESNVICVDYAMAGVGSNSCGPRLAEKYQLEKPLVKAHFHIQIMLFFQLFLRPFY